MWINKTVWLIMGILIPVVIIINVYIVWSNIEAQKEKLKEFRFQQNPNRALSDLQSGRITISEYCDQILLLKRSPKEYAPIEGRQTLYQ